MALTFNLGLKSLPLPSREELFLQAKWIDERKILLLYLFSPFFLSGAGLAFGGGGLAQILMTFASVKWVFFMVYAYVAWINKKNRLILLLIIAFEFTTALYSFFSSFKEVIFYTIIFSLSFLGKVNFKQVFYGILAVAALLFFFLTWTSIKED